MLEEIDGDRRLPIRTAEEDLGMALAFSLEKVELFRPLTHRFMFNALSAVGGRVAEVRIDRLAERTFYATAVLNGPSGPVEVDARPSDGLHLAVLAGAPNRVRTDVIDAANESTEETLNAFGEKYPEGVREILQATTAARQPPRSGSA